MSIDAKIVADLRRRTGLPMMKCKEALEETRGDLDAAEEHLRKLGLKTLEKVRDRALKEGLVFVRAGPEGAVAVSLLCNTDFVARSPDFAALGRAFADAIWASSAPDTGTGEEVASLKLADGKTVAQRIEDLVAKTRENMAVGAYARFRAKEGAVACYLHHNSKVAALVDLSGAGAAGSDAVRQLGNELGMHIVFHSDALALNRAALDPKWVAKEEEIYLAQVQDLPENKRASVAKGKLEKRLKEVTLLDQPYIKDEKKTVQQIVQEVGKAAGIPLSIRRFARIAAGA